MKIASVSSATSRCLFGFGLPLMTGILLRLTSWRQGNGVVPYWSRGSLAWQTTVAVQTVRNSTCFDERTDGFEPVGRVFNSPRAHHT
jgi:hypothetical protein